jgi:hypothetical protein
MQYNGFKTKGQSTNMLLTFNAKKNDLHLQNTEIFEIQQGNHTFIHQKLLRIIKIECQLQPYLHPMGYHLACKTRYTKASEEL